MWLDWDNQTRADQAGGCWHGPAAHVTTTQHSVVWSPQLSRAYPVANQSDKEDDDADESTKAQKGSEKKGCKTLFTMRERDYSSITVLYWCCLKLQILTPFLEEGVPFALFQRLLASTLHIDAFLNLRKAQLASR